MGLPVVPPIAMPIASFRMIANLSCGPSSDGSSTYKVPPAARVIAFAARRIFSSRWLMSFSWDGAAPISLSCSRRRNRSSTVSKNNPPVWRQPAWNEPLLDADRAHLRHIGNSLKHLFDPIHLQGSHAFLETDSEDIRDARVLLDKLFEGVGSDQEFMETDPALVAGITAGLATLGPIEGEMTFVDGVASRQIPVDVLVGGLGVSLERSGVEQLGAVFLEHVLHLVRAWRVRLLAFGAQALGQPLSEDAEQCVGKVEGVHPHVEQPGDRLGGAVRVQRGEHEVACQRRLYTRRRGFLVAH